MLNRPFAFAGVAMLALASAACGGTGPGPVEGPAPGLNQWTFGTHEHIALWYHGLALADVGTEAGQPVPIYRERYAETVATARTGAAGNTPFASGAVTLGNRMESAGVADRLQFLPLYFENWTQMLQAIDVWRQAGGDPNRAQGEAAAVIAFLSNLFPSPTQRAAVVDWVVALEAERSAFFAAWWRDAQPTALASEAETLWRSLQPDMIAFLRYTNAGSGRVSLTPALGGEGRVEMGRGFAAAAVGGRAGEDSRLIVARVIHELAYPLAAEAMRDAVAPARIREIGEDVLVARAAVRAGAMVLERIAPDLQAPYRDYYLRAAGADPRRTTLTDQFALPPELVPALESSVNLATAGI